MLEEVINREEKTEIEVAQEEAQKINEDVDELIAEMKAENRTQANAMVMERKEYQLKDQDQITKEESVRPYFLLVTESLKKDDLETAKAVMETLPPDKKQIFSEVRDILDRPFEKKQKQYLQEGKADKLAELMDVRDLVANQFDMKNLEKMSEEEKRSSEFVEAAKEFLLEKLHSITRVLSGDGLRQYIWTRNSLKKSGVDTSEIDSNREIRYSLVSVVVEDTKSHEPFIVGQIDHYNYLTSQLEIAGIMKKNELDTDPKTRRMFASILEESAEDDARLSGKEILQNFIKFRDRVSRLGIMDKESIDESQEIQERINQLLLNEISEDTPGKNKMGNVLEIVEIMQKEKMLSPDQVKKISQDNDFMREFRIALQNNLDEYPENERDEIFANWKLVIVKAGITSEKVMDQWLAEKKG